MRAAPCQHVFQRVPVWRPSAALSAINRALPYTYSLHAWGDKLQTHIYGEAKLIKATKAETIRYKSPIVFCGFVDMNSALIKSPRFVLSRQYLIRLEVWIVRCVLPP